MTATDSTPEASTAPRPVPTADVPDLPVVGAYDDELARLDAVATIEALDRGDLSVRQVVEAAIARAERVDPELGAVAFERYAAALAALPGRRRRGAFDGLPTFSKDMVAVAGLPLTWGSDALAGGPPAKRSAGVAVDFERMGFAIVGSSKMPEWGFTCSTEFPEAAPTRNPWNPNHSIGGSSGGAAALVASGVVPVAHAADGGGSIRIPAACGGLVGLKPTLGRLRRHSDEATLPVSVTVDGVVTRTVRDTARWYAEMERVHRNPKLPPMGEITGPPTRRLVVGLVTEVPGVSEPDAPTRATVASTAELLESLGHRVEPVALPTDAEQFRDDFVLYFQFLVFMATRTARLTHGSHVDIGRIADFTDGMARDFRRAPQRLVPAVRRLRRLRSELSVGFGRYDVLLTPTVTSVPPELGHLSTAVEYRTLLDRMIPWVAFTPLANAAGTPAISLPMGVDAATGLPLSAMLSADFGEDPLLVQLARELEQARPWALTRLH